MYSLIPFGRRSGKLARSAFDDVTDMFDNFFNSSFSFLNNNMRSDIKETDQGYSIDIELPGVNKKDIDIHLSDGYLTVSVNAHDDRNEENDNYVVRERRYGSCQRTFRVGSELKKSDIKASFENGVLNLNIPKTKENKKKEDTKIDIE